MLERAWGLSEYSPKQKLRAEEETKQNKKLTKKEVDTGIDWSCPICGKKHRLIHVETERVVKHVLRKTRS